MRRSHRSPLIEPVSPINRSIANLRQLSEEANRLVQRNAPRLDSIVANGETLSARGVLVMSNVDTLISSVQDILDQVQNEETSIGKILRDKEMYDDLKATVADLDTLVKNVQEDALKLRIRFGFGKKKKQDP